MDTHAIDLNQRLDLSQPLDLEDEMVRRFLATIQGNILKAHGRDYASHLFLTLSGDPGPMRRWIAYFAQSELTTALRQEEDTQAWIRNGRQGPGEPFAAFFVSREGYEALGLTDLCVPEDVHFAHGMKGASKVEFQTKGVRNFPIQDPPVHTWEVPFQRPVHAMVMLADDDPVRLEEREERIAGVLGSIVEALWIERGKRLRQQFPEFPETRSVIEHFGYRDGISDPLFFSQDVLKEREERGFDRWDPAAPPSLVLREDPAGGYGSFLVFRKLEQNVRAFNEAKERLADQLGLEGEARDRAGAMTVGRFKNGTPLVESTHHGPDGNNFHYFDQDREGAICPLHAHIRKMNPRGDTIRIDHGLGNLSDDQKRVEANRFERAHRIARRGITYGDRPDLVAGAPEDAPEEGVGLLFMSYQARLVQFTIQQSEANNPHFAAYGVGVDAVMGSRPQENVPQRWPTPSDNQFMMADLVRLRGGEYFFAPSRAFLTSLAS